MDDLTGSAGSHRVLGSVSRLLVRHRLWDVNSDSSEVSVSSLLFLGLFVLAAVLIMVVA